MVQLLRPDSGHGRTHPVRQSYYLAGCVPFLPAPSDSPIVHLSFHPEQLTGET
ncbi:hypothetical protein [Telluribacter sp. SYSU D00476]|uniref:hypothetical protein n=1 Tax=Telluribacter sp. SYSU D00476 TaxID=2811430 RepID=UPI001FF62196|nr:hypothetical protein [Telluribacter sp. SYSU D00476]